jgi:hypothetical protein
MVNPVQERSYEDLTVAQARVLRADQARLAASYADRAAQAHASGSRAATAHWTAAYKRSAVRCRVLGQLIRAELEQRSSVGAKANRAASGAYRPTPPSIAPRDSRGDGKPPLSPLAKESDPSSWLIPAFRTEEMSASRVSGSSRRREWRMPGMPTG